MNNPKKESILKKMTTLVRHKVTGKGAPYFKPLTELQVEDSSSIPKVQPKKDFKEYKKKL